MLKAVYGLRIAPKAWGAERDSKLKNITWKAEGKEYTLKQCAADSQVWRIVQKQSSHEPARATKQSCHEQARAEQSKEPDTTLGLLICYVDDLLFLSPQGKMRDGLKEKLKSIWEITEVDLLPGVPFTFLGIEIVRRKNGDLYIHQSTFTKNLLIAYGFDVMVRTSMNVTMGLPTDDDGPPDTAQLRVLQKFCGEFNWLATRTRPDVSYYISVIAQGITKYASWSLQFCKKVIRYLASTWDQGLLFAWQSSVDAVGLVSWSDASFAGMSTKSQTGVVIAWEGSIVLWRSSRQSSSALSTCEAEVAAAATSWQLVEGLRTLLHEWQVDVGIPILLVDNKSALRVSELGGTWRTRYFAIRAARLQEESAANKVSLRYCQTDIMMADGLTKLAGASVLQKLRDCCDGWLPPIPDESQSFKNTTDRATWWGKGLEVDYIRASLVRSSVAVAALSTTRPGVAAATTQTSSLEPSSTSTSAPTLSSASTPSSPSLISDEMQRQVGAQMAQMMQMMMGAALQQPPQSPQ